MEYTRRRANKYSGFLACRHWSNTVTKLEKAQVKVLRGEASFHGVSALDLGQHSDHFSRAAFRCDGTMVLLFGLDQSIRADHSRAEWLAEHDYGPFSFWPATRRGACVSSLPVLTQVNHGARTRATKATVTALWPSGRSSPVCSCERALPLNSVLLYSFPSVEHVHSGEYYKVPYPAMSGQRRLAVVRVRGPCVRVSENGKALTCVARSRSRTTH